MVETVAYAKVVYTGDDKGFQRTSKRVNSSVKDNIRRFKSLALVTAGATAALGLFVKRALDAAEAISDTAKKANASVKGLQELRFAADKNGASARDMDDALTRLTRRMSLFAIDGTGPAAKALAALSINVKDLDGNLRQSDVVFAEIVERFGQLESNAEKAALASQLFGEDAGPRLVPLLNQGTDGIAKFAEKAKAMGIILDDVAVNKAAAANAELRAIGNSLNSLVTAAILQNSDAILGLATDISEFWIPALRNAGKAMGDFLGPVFNAIVFIGQLNDKFREAYGVTLPNFWLALSPPAFVAGALKDLKIGEKLKDARKLDFSSRTPDSEDELYRMFGWSPNPDPGFGVPLGGFERDKGRVKSSPDGKKMPEVPSVEVLEESTGTWLERYYEFLNEREGATKSSVAKINSIEEKAGREKVTTMGGFLDMMASNTSGAYGKMFKVLAEFAGKEGLINTYRAAAQTLSDPKLPFWAKAAAVGGVIAQGMSLVSSIQQVSGVSAGGASAAAGGVAPQASGGGGSQGNQFINLNLVGDNFSREAVVALIGQFNEAIEDGAQLGGVRAT